MVGSVRDPELGWWQKAIIRRKIALRDEEDKKKKDGKCNIMRAEQFDEPGWIDKDQVKP